MTEPVYPHAGLILGHPNSILVSGPHIRVIQTQTGETVHSTLTVGESERSSAIKSGPVRCYTANQSLSVFITSGDDKKLKVWQTKDLKILSERELPKKPTQIRLTHDEQTIVVSDKFGDVFSYPLSPDPSVVPGPDQGKRGALTSHENPSNGTLVLGHTSLLTSFLLTRDEKYIVTADRDEHVRISWYPQGYIIERYCLGHKKFVSAIHIPTFAPSTLISGGGDPELKVWDWLSGKLLYNVPILDIVEPFIKVKALKWKGGDEEEEGGPASASHPSKGRRRRRRGKGKEEEQEGELAVAEDANEGETEKEGDTVKGDATTGSPDVLMDEGDNTTSAQPNQNQQDSERTTLVIRRIDSADRGSLGRYIVFSAVGCTALFQFAFSSEVESSSPPMIRALDLGKPVIDFVVGDDGLIWVLVDSRWVPGDDESTPAGTTSNPVRLIGWSDECTLVECSDTPPLLSALNSKCILPASEADLKTLDLYSHLSSMPKNVDAEHDPMVAEDLTELAMSLDEKAPPPVAKNKGKGKGRGKGPDGGLTQRELARLKNKRALLAKIQEQQQTQGATPDPTTVDGEEEREVKKVKADEVVEGAMDET